MPDGLWVGRFEELAALESSLVDVASMRATHAVVVTGDPGVGKSSLVDAFAGTGLGDRATCVRAAPTAAERCLTWSTLRMLVASTTASHDSLPVALRVALGFTDPDGTTGAVDAADVAYGFGRLLSAEPPDAVVIDDAQWIDDASAAALSHAMRLGLPTLWLLAARTGHALPVDVEALVGRERVRRIDLAGFSRAEVAELVARSTTRSWQRSELDRIHALTGGNALFVCEIAASTPPEQTLDRLRLPATLAQLFDDRLTAVTTDVHDVLAIAALAVGPTMTGLELCRDKRVDGELEFAERLGLIEVDGDRVEFRHALIRQAVVDRLGGMERRRVHNLLANCADDPEVRAWHLGQGAVEPDAAIADALADAAAAAAERGVPARAAELHLRSAELTPAAMVAARHARIAAAGRAACDAGDWQHGKELIESVIAHDAGEQLVDDALSLSVCLDRLEDQQGAADVLASAVERLTGEPALQSGLLRTLVRLQQFSDIAVAARTAQRALEIAPRADELAVLGAELAAASSRFLLGEYIDVDTLDRRTAELAPVADGQSAPWFLAELLVWSDRHERALVWLSELERHARHSGRFSCLTNVLDQRSDLDFRTGAWGDATRRIDELRELVGAFGPYSETILASERIRMAAVSGDHGTAATLVDGAAGGLGHLAPIVRMQFEANAGLAALAASRWDDAVAHLDVAHALATEVGYTDVRANDYLAAYAEALVRSSRHDDADDVIRILDDVARRSRSPVATGLAERCRGIAAAARGDHDRACVALERAVALLADVGRPFELGRSLLALGAAQRKRRERSRAKATLDRAVSIFETLGARPWLESATGELARLGIRTVDPAGPGALTATEERIADLVAAGRSNREVATELIISLRTVESNLTRIYRKLDVRSRTELATRWPTRSDPAEPAIAG